MLEEQVERLVKQITNALPGSADIDTAVREVREFLDSMELQLDEELEEAKRRVVLQYSSVEILRRHSIFQKRSRWYLGPRPTDNHWPALREYLSNVKGFHPDDVAQIDNSSNDVVSLLENPNQHQFSCRGLVVGHVQSGKTANMTAVMAKSLDAGYDTIIVLAGLTNKLRYQTQMRMFSDLISRRPLEWQVLTPNDIDRDFRAPPQGGFLAHSNKAQIAVIKKNVSPLRELKQAIQDTLPAALRQLRILIIDDECDQASVNSARGELDMTAINQRIREILHLLPAVSYVGYTATPFANVLINPYTLDGQELDDLYPRDFITSLEKPTSYFGTEQLFGRTPEDPDNPRDSEEGLDMVRLVPEEEERLLQPSSRNKLDEFDPQMNESLSDAMLYFLACCAARIARGHTDKHMTMLVHTSAYVLAHEKVAFLIKNWFENHKNDLVDSSKPVGRRLSRLWESEQNRLPADITQAAPVSTEQVFACLPEVVKKIEFPIENGASDDRIDYERQPRTYIVVGGSILARGLTLEGLMVSYFLRSANQYDTLLQMGRWFGFRPGYEDLPRIWMPEDLKLKFRAMADIEQEIRDEIEQYSARDLTPLDIAVRIRSIPGMAITGNNKLRAAKQCAISFWGTHRQTFRFKHLDSELLLENWRVGAKLVQQADDMCPRQDPSVKLWRGVPREVIREFFQGYKSHPAHSDLTESILLPFIANSDSRLDFWNVGVIEAGRGATSEQPLGPAQHVKMVNRAKLVDAGSTADIKALMSKQDVVFDCDDSGPNNGSWEELKQYRTRELGEIPLLLLYPIDRDSKPKRDSKVREPLLATHDILAYGIVFPGSIAEGGSYVSVELNPLSADEIEAIDDEEVAQTEAAGV